MGKPRRPQAKEQGFREAPREADFEAGRFTVINDPFDCEHCGRQVPPLKAGCRNHCPFCLTSKHVDVLPGDRQNPCQGLLEACGYELEGRKGIMILFRCARCGETVRNKAALEDPLCPDDYDRILRLTPRPTRV
jgi:DNA-directed RNA polymerase subunit RPC12/RpoP